MIHNSLLDTKTTSKWPPTPQEIVESNNDIDTDLFNLVSWNNCITSYGGTKNIKFEEQVHFLTFSGNGVPTDVQGHPLVAASV